MSDACPECALIEQWRHLPLSVAGGYAHGDEDLRDELTSVGLIALVEAARIWEPNPKGFGRFATTRIRWAMLDELRRQGRYSQRQVQLLMVARRVQREGQLDEIARQEWGTGWGESATEGE